MKKIVAALLMLPITALAADQGAYLAADWQFVGYGNASVPSQATGAYPNPDALRIAGGYRLSRNSGLEAAYSQLGDSTVNYTNGATTLQMSALQLAATGNYPISERFELFGKLGVTRIAARISGTGLAALLTANGSTNNLMCGLGVQYNLGTHFALRAQYENLGHAKLTASLAGTPQTPTRIGVSALSVGAVYRF